MEVGKEVCLRYGSHSNQSLFVEYGFINPVSNEEMESGTYPAEVDMQALMIDLFEERGAVGSWMQKILENEGYWGYVQRELWNFHSLMFLQGLDAIHLTEPGCPLVSVDHCAPSACHGLRDVLYPYS